LSSIFILFRSDKPRSEAALSARISTRSFDLLRLFFGQQLQDYAALNRIWFNFELLNVINDILALDESFHGFIHDTRPPAQGEETVGSRDRLENDALESGRLGGKDPLKRTSGPLVLRPDRFRTLLLIMEGVERYV
jgi:hypothetical protein